MALCSQKRIQHTKLQPPGNNAIENAIEILKALEIARFAYFLRLFESLIPCQKRKP